MASGTPSIAWSNMKIVGPYTLALRFDDGSEQRIDFRPVLEGEVFGPLQDLQMFNAVELDATFGTLQWPNGADFDPETLHDWPKYRRGTHRDGSSLGCDFRSACRPAGQHANGADAPLSATGRRRSALPKGAHAKDSPRDAQSSGSTFMIRALRVLTIHSVDRPVVGSWAIFFESKSVGIWYVDHLARPRIEADQAFGRVARGIHVAVPVRGRHGVRRGVLGQRRPTPGTCSVRVSNMPILSPVYSANQKRSCASIRLRRGDELGVGTGQNLATFVTASMPMMCEPRKSGAYGLPLESIDGEIDVQAVRSRAAGSVSPSRCRSPSTFMVFGSIRFNPAQIFPSGPIARNWPPAPFDGAQFFGLRIELGHHDGRVRRSAVETRRCRPYPPGCLGPGHVAGAARAATGTR